MGFWQEDQLLNIEAFLLCRPNSRRQEEAQILGKIKHLSQIFKEGKSRKRKYKCKKEREKIKN